MSIDILSTTYNEDPQLVRFGILDAKKTIYPHPIDIRIHILDDGRRDKMRAVAVNYIARTSNEGLKAGNLRHAIRTPRAI